MARFIQPQLAGAHAASVTLRKTEAPLPAGQREESKTLAGMMLAAVLAALLVVAAQVIDTWTDGHLLLGWVALWTVAFAALALLAPPLRQLCSTLALALAHAARELKQRRLEESMWEHAKQDPRIMAELQGAMMRHREEN